MKKFIKIILRWFVKINLILILFLPICLSAQCSSPINTSVVSNNSQFLIELSKQDVNIDVVSGSNLNVILTKPNYFFRPNLKINFNANCNVIIDGNNSNLGSSCSLPTGLNWGGIIFNGGSLTIRNLTIKNADYGIFTALSSTSLSQTSRIYLENVTFVDCFNSLFVFSNIYKYIRIKDCNFKFTNNYSDYFNSVQKQNFVFPDLLKIDSDNANSTTVWLTGSKFINEVGHTYLGIYRNQNNGIGANLNNVNLYCGKQWCSEGTQIYPSSISCPDLCGNGNWFENLYCGIKVATKRNNFVEVSHNEFHGDLLGLWDLYSDNSFIYKNSFYYDSPSELSESVLGIRIEECHDFEVSENDFNFLLISDAGQGIEVKQSDGNPTNSSIVAHHGLVFSNVFNFFGINNSPGTSHSVCLFSVPVGLNNPWVSGVILNNYNTNVDVFCNVFNINMTLGGCPNSQVSDILICTDLLSSQLPYPYTVKQIWGKPTFPTGYPIFEAGNKFNFKIINKYNFSINATFSPSGFVNNNIQYRFNVNDVNTEPICQVFSPPHSIFTLPSTSENNCALGKTCYLMEGGDVVNDSKVVEVSHNELTNCYLIESYQEWIEFVNLVSFNNQDYEIYNILGKPMAGDFDKLENNSNYITLQKLTGKKYLLYKCFK